MCNEENRAQWALTLIRMVLGFIFIAHGSQKVFGILGGPGLEGFAQWLQTYGIPPFLSYSTAFLELISGIMLFFGIFAEIGALLAIPIMLGAIYLVHWPFGFFVQNKGYEYALSLGLFSLAILIGGPGKLALWNYCFRCNKKS